MKIPIPTNQKIVLFCFSKLNKNKMYIFFLLYLCSLTLPTILAAQIAPVIAIKFEKGTWYEILAKAKIENKLIFVDAYAEYCPPCKIMHSKVFTDKKVATFYNEHFINYRLDVEDGENTYFKALHHIHDLPTLLYLYPNGNLIKKEVGVQEVDDFLTLGQEIISGKKDKNRYKNTPEYKAYKELRKTYKRGTRTPEVLREYAYSLQKFNKPYNTVVNEYLLSQKDMETKENLDFMYDFTTNIENNVINHFIKHIGYFKRIHSGKNINEKIKTAVYNSILTAIRERDEDLFKKAKQVILQSNLPDTDWFTFEMASLYYQGIEDWNSYARVAHNYLKDKKITNPVLLNDISSKFHQYINDEKNLALAIGWVKKSIHIENEYYNNKTYAALLYKLGDVDLAIKVAKKAMHIAKLRHIKDYQEIIRMLDRMQSEKQRK